MEMNGQWSQNGGGGGDYIDCILLLFLHHCDILTFLLKNTKFWEEKNTYMFIKQNPDWVLHTLSSRRPLVHSLPAHRPPFLLVLLRGCVLPLGWGWQRQLPNLQELYHRHSPNLFDKNFFRSFLAVEGLGLHVSKSGGVGSIPGLGTHIPHPTCHVEHPKRNLLIKTQNIAYFASLWPLYTIISSVQSLSRVQFSVTPWTAARWASLSITNSQSSPKLMSIKSVMPFSHLILCHPLLLLPPVLPSISLVFNSLPFYFLS